MVALLHTMQKHSYISSEEQHLLCELLQKGYIGGWEATAKAKLSYVWSSSSMFHIINLTACERIGKAPMMTEAFASGMLSKLMGWLEKMHLIATTNALTEMKILFFAAEVTNFVFRVLADILPSDYKKQMLRELCNILLRFGNARRQHGIMKAIGIGGSLKYNVEFHVSCLTIGIFLRLQTRNGAPLRVEERIPYKMTRTTEKHLRSLEQLLSSKNCFQLQKRMEWMVEFLKSPSRSLADQDEFFVSLFSRIYPSHPWLLAKCITSTS
ncbi:hypothetical protein P43SY_010053 [Pythium insidiosum]|uniref:Uncharacterized protein n=1 Tax=Pythium insidiosum TaxID=114742 RepID=A0AAD5QC23_PYTIN|nr:hypothetical protein P43SY_010053 [Pythium insidiosum]